MASGFLLTALSNARLDPHLTRPPSPRRRASDKALTSSARTPRRAHRGTVPGDALSTFCHRELSPEKGRQVFSHPVCRLFVSVGNLKQRKVCMVLAYDLQAHRQPVSAETEGHIDNRQRG